LSAVSCQAGLLLYPEVPLTTSISHIHSPTAFSHQSITQIHGKDEKVIVRPSKAGYLSKTPFIYTDLIMPEKASVETSQENSVGHSFHHKDKTPVFTSDTHTPAHLTYAAMPVVYKMLPSLEANPFINNSPLESYTRFKF
ncbi:hypothetical protein DOY81_007069, partial [Sarcophaga bullata]